MKHWFLPLLFVFGTAQAALPQPIPITQPVYAVSVLSNIQINYLPPFLWVRFIMQTGIGPMYYCYKIDPTVPPASTNGWTSALQFWSTSQWLPQLVPMPQADIDWCWQ